MNTHPCEALRRASNLPHLISRFFEGMRSENNSSSIKDFLSSVKDNRHKCLITRFNSRTKLFFPSLYTTNNDYRHLS